MFIETDRRFGVCIHHHQVHAHRVITHGNGPFYGMLKQQRPQTLALVPTGDGQLADFCGRYRQPRQTGLLLFGKLPQVNLSRTQRIETQDFTRLTPASDGNSFAGRNDQFNNFSLDGSIFNNPFGLDAATPGGQAEAQPISLDAIDQINVALAPFDITQAGFTGAAVNAVTKSGTNKFSGTVFGFWRNQGLTGKKIEGQDVPEADLDQIQAGFSLGGPIIKNKLFFFVNAELDNRSDLGTTWIPQGSSADGQVSRVSLTDMQMVADASHDKENARVLVALLRDAGVDVSDPVIAGEITHEVGEAAEDVLRNVDGSEPELLSDSAGNGSQIPRATEIRPTHPDAGTDPPQRCERTDSPGG